MSQIFGYDGKVLRPTEDAALGKDKSAKCSRHQVPGTAARIGQLVSLRCHNGETLIAVVRKDNGRLTTKVVRWVKGVLVAQ